MKKITVFFFVAILLLQSLNVLAQKDQTLMIGINDNQFPFAGYNYNDKWSVYIMNSLFFRELNAQYIRLYGGYTYQFKKIKTELDIFPYLGTNYGGAYYDFGLDLKADKYWSSKFETSAGLIPTYDSDKGFYLCYSGTVSYWFLNDASANIKISDYPEFRIPENRISLSLLFDVYELAVRPVISIPINGDIRTGRVLVSFIYSFPIAGKNTKSKRIIID